VSVRDYQCEIIDNFDRRVGGDPRSALIAAPTSGGKAVLVASGVLADFVRATRWRSHPRAARRR
jgi:superfamily II DNA or RNA helicase